MADRVFPLNITTFFYVFIYKCTSLTRKNIWTSLVKLFPPDMDNSVNETAYDETLFYKYFDGSREIPKKLQSVMQNIQLDDIGKWVKTLKLVEVKYGLTCFEWMIEQELLGVSDSLAQEILQIIKSESSQNDKVAKLFKCSFEEYPRIKRTKNEYKMLIAYKELANNKAKYLEGWPGISMRSRIRQYVTSITNLKPNPEYYAFLYVMKYCYEHEGESGCTAQQIIKMSTKMDRIPFCDCSIEEMEDILSLACMNGPLIRDEEKNIYKPSNFEQLQLLLSKEEVANELNIPYIPIYY